MTLAFVGSPTVAGSTIAATPTIPDGSVGDYIIFLVDWGFSTAASASDRPIASGGLSGTTGFHLGSGWGGGGTYGTGTGPRGVSAFMGVATATTGATDATTFTLPGGNTGVVGAGAARVSHGAGQSVAAAFTFGLDTTSGDSWAPTGFTNVGATTGDIAIHWTAAVPNTTNPTAVLTWTGATLGTEAALFPSINVGSGQGVRMNVRQRAVSSGTATATPSVASSTTGLTGAHGLLRIREVSASNVPPTVAAGSDQTIDPNLVDTFTITATASDSDGTIASYVWEDITSGAVAVAGSGASRTIAVVRTPLQTTHTYRITVTDNGGATATDTVNVVFMAHTRWIKTSTGTAPLRRVA